MGRDKDQGGERRQAEAGYGQPPKSGQFKPGRSGNPKGRPKGTKGLAAIVREQAGRKVQVQADGRNVSMSFSDAMIMRLMRDAVSGKRGAIEQTLRLLERYLPEDEQGEDEDGAHIGDLTMHELNQMEQLSRKARGQTAAYWILEEESLKARFDNFSEQKRIGIFRDKDFAEYIQEIKASEEAEQRLVDEANEKIRNDMLARVTAAAPSEPVAPHPGPRGAERTTDEWLEDEEED